MDPDQLSLIANDFLAAFLRGELPWLCQDADGRLRADATPPIALLCGSFNPLHDGHRRLAEAAAARLGVAVAYEMAIVNADKPPLTAVETLRRLRQFPGLAPLWLTREPTFAEKSRLFPGTTFVVGADTVERIVSPRFYGGSAERMRLALTVIQSSGCRFVVAGRADVTGRFIAADEIAIPKVFRDLFEALPEREFRSDLSSTHLRASPADG